MAKRTPSGISRVIGVDKPVGMSSHDVVNRVRKLYNERRVGHTGTLDPLASGVLTVCVGPATRLNPYLVDHDKTYLMIAKEALLLVVRSKMSFLTLRLLL